MRSRRPAKHTSIAPRKQPRQERAHATVEAILQAATYILSRAGWDAFTTKAVADRAGVNIASLYQYFPNKLALVAELRRRHLAELRSCASSGPPPKTLKEALARGVDTMIKQRLVNPELHRVFSDELPRSVGLWKIDPVARASWDPTLLPRVPDLELSAFIAHAAVAAAVDQAARDRPSLLESADFRDELVLLLERYLAR